MYRDIRGAMVKFPYVASPDMTLTEAALYMKECRIRHLPVIADDQILGLVSERDLKEYQDGDRFQDLCLHEIIKYAAFVVSENEDLKSVLGMMASNKMGSALVVNSENQLTGIFTTTDALLLLQSLLDGDPKFYDHKPGEVILLRELANWN